MSMVTKLGRMVTYYEEHPPIKSHEPLITWSLKTTWQNKKIISPLPDYLCPSNLTRL